MRGELINVTLTNRKAAADVTPPSVTPLSLPLGLLILPLGLLTLPLS